MDKPPVHTATIVEEVSETTLYIRMKNFPAILRNEDDVVEEAMERMPTLPEHGFVGHASMMTAQ